MTPADVLSGARQWVLINGDCLDPVTGLACLPGASVDHVITDPPYSARLYERTRTNKGSGKRPCGRRTSRGEGSPNSSPLVLASGRIGAVDDVIAPVSLQFLRTARRWSVIFHDAEILDRWRAAMDIAYVRSGVWVKTDPMPQVTGDRPAQGFEMATVAHCPGRRMRWNGGGRPAVWTFGTSKGGERPEHPCPKPLALMEALIRDFTDPGEIVVDPFAGSGTTGVACIRLGRRFIGWERDPKFYEAALRRLEQTHEQPDLLATESFRREAKKKRKQTALDLPDPEAA